MKNASLVGVRQINLYRQLSAVIRRSCRVLDSTSKLLAIFAKAFGYQAQPKIRGPVLRLHECGVLRLSFATIWTHTKCHQYKKGQAREYHIQPEALCRQACSDRESSKNIESGLLFLTLNFRVMHPFGRTCKVTMMT